MIGERLYPNLYGKLRLPEGGYGQDMKGKWWGRPPGGDMQPMHSVHEHEDGSVTAVAGLNGHQLRLQRGVWRDK